LSAAGLKFLKTTVVGKTVPYGMLGVRRTIATVSTLQSIKLVVLSPQNIHGNMFKINGQNTRIVAFREM
jgi:hypothetical protein